VSLRDILVIKKEVAATQVCSFVTQLKTINISSIRQHSFNCAVNSSRRTSVQTQDSQWHQNVYRQTTNTVLMCLFYAEITSDQRPHAEGNIFLLTSVYELHTISFCGLLRLISRQPPPFPLCPYLPERFKIQKYSSED
jgi:hypothetical protein